MKKNKTARFQFTASPLIETYVQRLLRRGTFGDTRTEVIRRLVCEGLMNHLGGQEVQRMAEDYHNRGAAAKDQLESPQ